MSLCLDDSSLDVYTVTVEIVSFNDISLDELSLDVFGFDVFCLENFAPADFGLGFFWGFGGFSSFVNQLCVWRLAFGVTLISINL